MSKRFATNPKPKTPAATKKRGPLNKSELAEAAAAQEAADQARWAAEDAAASGQPISEGAATNEKDVDIASESSEAPKQIEPGDTPDAGMPPAAKPTGRNRTASMKTITATLAPKQRKSKNIVMFTLSDRKNAIQLPKTLFAADSLVEGFSFEISGNFSDPVVAAPRKRLTKEERAALPKPTLADRVKKAQEKAARLAKKLEEASKAESQPAADAAQL